MSIYRSPDQKLEYFLTDLLDHYFKSDEEFIILGDLIKKKLELELTSFLKQQNCKNKNRTWYKSMEGSCID